MALKQRRASHGLATRLASQERAGLETAPPERFRHGQELAPAPMTRAPHQIANGVQTLYSAQRVGNSELAAAKRFHKNYVFGILGVRDPGEALCSSATDPHMVQLARCKAVTAHRAVAGILGPDLTAHLVAFVVDDLSMTAMDRRFTLNGHATSDGRKGVAIEMATLLVVLTGLYATIDRQRQQPGGARARRDQLRAAAAGEFDEIGLTPAPTGRAIRKV